VDLQHERLRVPVQRHLDREARRQTIDGGWWNVFVALDGSADRLSLFFNDSWWTC
jgi:hypothetical protein